MATNRRKTKQNTPHRASGSRPGTDVRRNTAAPRHKRPDKVRQPVLNEPDKTKTGAPDIGTIQWFPGHMARTRRKIQESLSMVDAVVEIVDARIPLASRNPELDKLTGKKPRLVVLNKADLADEAVTNRWVTWFREQGVSALAMDCKSGRST